MNKYTFLFGTALCQSVYCGCCGGCKNKKPTNSKNSKPLTSEVHSKKSTPPLKNKHDKVIKPGTEDFFNKCFNEFNVKYGDLFNKDTNKDFIKDLFKYLKDNCGRDSDQKDAKFSDLELNKMKFCKACDHAKLFNNDGFWNESRKDIPEGICNFANDLMLAKDETILIYRISDRLWIRKFDSNINMISQFCRFRGCNYGYIFKGTDNMKDDVLHYCKGGIYNHNGTEIKTK